MKRLSLIIATILTAGTSNAVGISLPAHGHAALASHTMTVTANKPRTWRLHSATSLSGTENYTVCAYVNGDPLLIGDPSGHGLVATYYGDNSVVRMEQRGNRTILVRVATVSPREIVRVSVLRGLAAC